MSALAEALAPLCRAYLRRLEEMAARLGEHVAREPVARDGKGELLRHESGLLLRLDLVDSSTGEVFEVHGARPDDPAQREVRVGSLEVRLDAGNWEELTVRCVFGRPPSRDDSVAFVELLRGWAVLASSGGFAAPPNATGARSWSGRLHSIDVRTGDAGIVAVLDLGTCPPAAFDPLVQALAELGRERVPLAAIQIGGSP